MTGRKVVVTGMGAVSAAGTGTAALWQAARDGQGKIGPVEFSHPYIGRVRLGARVPDFDTSAIGKELLPYCDFFAQYAIAAADEALKSAGLARDGLAGPRTAVLLGTGIGGAHAIDEGLYRVHGEKARPELLAIPKLIPSAGPAALTIRYGCTGPSFAIASACSSGTQAIGLGLQMIRAGLIDRALVGGAEACLTNGGQVAWENLRVLTPDKCRPFSKGRNGMNLGEGAAIFVLETAESAKARGAEPLCELAGYGTSSDAYDPVRPDVKGAVMAMQLALADAGLRADEIDYVNAHGTATILNDATESQAMQRVFGDRGRLLPISSTKPIHGHALGASGALELVCAISAMRENVAPPTLNWLVADPACQVDCVPNVARDVPMQAVLSNSFAFGGINAVLALRKLAA
jgi:nodulation protein E